MASDFGLASADAGSGTTCAMSVKLIFHIRKGLLEVRAAGKTLKMLADSGGGAGSMTWFHDRFGREYQPSADRTLIDNPDMTWFQAPSEALVRPESAPSRGFEGKRWVLGWRGGPIPTGYYSIQKPRGSGFARRARLKPYLVSWPKHIIRTDLEIHFRGPKGSDACVVPRQPRDFTELMDLLSKEGGPQKGYAGFLHVVAE